MEVFEEMLGIEKMTEKRPYSDDVSQTVLSEWCEAHGKVWPEYVGRKEWESLDTYLEKDTSGRTIIKIPKDLALWELPSVAQEMDIYLLEKPRGEALSRMIQLGEKLENAAVYMAKRIKAIEEKGSKEGRRLAEETIRGLYGYGKSLQSGKRYTEEIEVVKIAGEQLTAEETGEVDRWLAGEEYERLLEKARNKKSLLKRKSQENVRQETLARYFQLGGRLLRGWRPLSDQPRETSMTRDYLEKMRSRVNNEINQPEGEMNRMVFNLGKEMLTKGVVSRLAEFVGEGKKTVYEHLNIPALREELEAVRKTGTPEKTGRKEVEIAEKIQRETERLKYRDGFAKPSLIVEHQEFNCVGFSMLAAALFEEAGLVFLGVNLKRHSVGMLVTTDDRLIVMDMQNHDYNLELFEEDIIKKTASIKEIAQQARNGTFETGWLRTRRLGVWQKIFPVKMEGMSLYIGRADSVLSAQIWDWLEDDLRKLGNREGRITCLLKAIEANKHYETAYTNLGIVDSERSEKWYRRAVALEPDVYTPYHNLALITKNEREKEVLFLKSASLGHVEDYCDLGLLYDNQGRWLEASEVYLKYAQLAKTQTSFDQDRIDRAIKRRDWILHEKIMPKGF